MTAQEELERKAYQDLVKYARWLGNTRGVKGHWMLDPDDLMAEALYALARCMRKYSEEPYERFLVVSRTAMSNAVGTLIYKAALTHRKVEMSQKTMRSLSEVVDKRGGCMFEDCPSSILLEDIVPGGTEPDEQCLSAERVAELVSKLTTFEVRVLNALLGREPGVVKFLRIHSKRLSSVYKNPTVTLDSYVLASALMEPEDRVKRAMGRIKELVNNGSD